MDGIGATRHITEDESLAGVRILMPTTFEADVLVVSAVQAGASGYLGKGVNPAALPDAIRTVTFEESLLSPVATTTLIQRLLTHPVENPQASLPVVDDRTSWEREAPVMASRGLSNGQIGATERNWSYSRIRTNPCRPTHHTKSALRGTAHRVWSLAARVPGPDCGLRPRTTTPTPHHQSRAAMHSPSLDRVGAIIVLFCEPVNPLGGSAALALRLTNPAEADATLLTDIG